jgi:hypothetical protein
MKSGESMIDRVPLDERRSRSRNLCLSLALFIFSITSVVHLLHTCNREIVFAGIGPDRVYTDHGSARYPSIAGYQVCLACLLIDGFHAAQISAFFLLLVIAGVLSLRVWARTGLRSAGIVSDHYIRGPPGFTPSH